MKNSHLIKYQSIFHTCTSVVSFRRYRLNSRGYDKPLYNVRHLVENAFLKMKHWRDIAMRYAKRTDSFLSAVQIRCISLWAKIYWRHYLEGNFVNLSVSGASHYERTIILEHALRQKSLQSDSKSAILSMTSLIIKTWRIIQKKSIHCFRYAKEEHLLTSTNVEGYLSRCEKLARDLDLQKLADTVAKKRKQAKKWHAFT